MRYNVIKKMGKAKSFEFILKGVEWEKAIEELRFIKEWEKQRYMADISCICYTNNPNLVTFDVKTVSGETIIYQIEEDQFFTWGEIFRPATFGKRSLETINYN